MGSATALTFVVTNHCFICDDVLFDNCGKYALMYADED